MSQTYGYAPRLMQAREAARYLGMSESKFRSLELRSKRSGGNRLWDVRDLDDYANRLEYDGENPAVIDIVDPATFIAFQPFQLYAAALFCGMPNAAAVASLISVSHDGSHEGGT